MQQDECGYRRLSTSLLRKGLSDQGEGGGGEMQMSFCVVLQRGVRLMSVQKGGAHLQLKRETFHLTSKPYHNRELIFCMSYYKSVARFSRSRHHARITNERDNEYG